MSTKSIDIRNYQPAKKRATISIGESVSSVRALQSISLEQLAETTKLPLIVLQAIESDSLQPDLEQAKVLARALRVHPAVLVFPNWEIEEPTT